MIKRDIPVNNAPVDFQEREDIKYPCDTQYMEYNPLEHKYFLTKEALDVYGIDVQRKYVSDSPDKTKEFIEKVTKKVYDYIAYKSGWKVFNVLQYRIAQSLGKMYDKYEFRKQFEKALVTQAQFLIDNGDSARFSMNNFESGVFNKVKPEEDFMDTGDISPETKRSLNFMGLDRWFSIVQYGRLNTDEY